MASICPVPITGSRKHDTAIAGARTRGRVSGVEYSCGRVSLNNLLPVLVVWRLSVLGRIWSLHDYSALHNCVNTPNFSFGA